MLVLKLGLLLFVFKLAAAEAELWTVPTATDMQTAVEACQLANSFLDNASLNENTDIRCLARELGLWTDDAGFTIKRFAKLLNKYNQPIEISLVIDFCNKSRKRADPDKWAKEAFNCFAKGRIGLWISEFIKSAYKNKINE